MHGSKYHNKNILIVEDDEMSFIYLNQIFKLTNAKVIRAKTGSEAMFICKTSESIDAILMDIQLPDFDGNEVTREIRKFNTTIPIIAQTAGKTEVDKNKALNAGCSEVLVKPFNMEDLFELLDKYLS